MHSAPALAPSIDDVDEAAYWRHVDQLAGTFLAEPVTRLYLAVLAALAGGDQVGQLLADDRELVDEMAVIGLVARGRPTELGHDVLAATGR